MKVGSQSKNTPCPLPPQTKPAQFLPALIEKTKKDLLDWYPPLVAQNNPGVRAALVALFPPLGAVFEMSRQIYEGFMNLLTKKSKAGV